MAVHNMLQKHSVAYLADEVGLGKTYVALTTLAIFRHFNPDFRALIIAPRQNIQLKWMKDWRTFVRTNWLIERIEGGLRAGDLREGGLRAEDLRQGG